MEIKAVWPYEPVEGMQMKHEKRWLRLLAAVLVLMLVLPTVTSALAASYPYDEEPYQTLPLYKIILCSIKKDESDT